MANYYRSGYDKTARTWIGIIAVVLALVIAGAIALGVITNGFTDWSKFQPDKQEEQTEEGNQLVANVSDNALMSIQSFAARDSDSVTFTATVKDEAGGTPAAIQQVTWSAAWTNPSSGWASGKNVTDYITVTPSGTSVTVTCKQAFGAQIELTCQSTLNESVNATATVDYRQRLQGFDATFLMHEEGTKEMAVAHGTVIQIDDCGANGPEGAWNELEIGYIIGTTSDHALTKYSNWGVGSATDSVSSVSVNYEFSEDFKSELESSINLTGETVTYTVGSTGGQNGYKLECIGTFLSEMISVNGSAFDMDKYAYDMINALAATENQVELTYHVSLSSGGSQEIVAYLNFNATNVSVNQITLNNGSYIF